MKLKLTFLLIFSLFPTLIFAQYDYYKTYTGNYNSSIEIVEELETYNEKTVASGRFLSVLNKQGQVQWAKEISPDTIDFGYQYTAFRYDGLVATPDGGFIGIATQNLKGYVSRFDSLGNQIWSKSYKNPTKTTYINGILKTSTNEYILLIQHAITSSISHNQWLKIDGNGNTIWQKSYNIPNNGLLSMAKENNLGYIMAAFSGTVVQIDFNGNLIWTRNHEMRLQNIFTFGNNDYVLAGFNGIYTHHTFQRVTNSGTILWTKGIPTPSPTTGSFFDSQFFNQLSDDNIVEVRPVPSTINPLVADIMLIKLSTQTGQVLWRKKYLTNVPIGSSPYVRDYIILNDSIFKMFPLTILQTNTYYYGNYMRINIGYNPDATNCILQNAPLITSFDEVVTNTMVQPVLQTMPLAVQSITLFYNDIILTDNVVCENGIAANFLIDNHILCKDDCINITDTSSGNITNWEWTFFGSDTTFHNDRFPPQLCYDTTGIFSIQLVVSNSSITDTLRKTIKVFELPEINLGQDTILCEGQFIAPNFQIPNANFLWNNGASTPYYFINNSGLYSVEVTNGGCYETDSILVIIIDKPNVGLGVDTSFCNTNNYLIDATIPIGNYTYEWQDNSTNPQFLATISGLYSVTITDTSGCENTDEVLISFNVPPSVNLGSDTSICQGETITLNAVTINATYSWNDNSTDSILMVNNSGVYTVEINVNGCFASDTIIITVENLPMINLGNDTTFCNANGYNLTANTSDNVTFLWNNNAIMESIFINNSGIYSLIVMDTFTTCQATDSIEINLIQSANFDLGNDTILCQGENLSLDVFIQNATYLWNDNSTDSDLIINNSGIYSVDVRLNNCVESDTISVVFNDLPTVNLGNDTTFCNENNIELIANSTSNNINFLWNNNATTDNVFINNSAIYSVIVTDTLTNCQATDSVEIKLIQTNNFDLGNDTILCKNQTILLNAFVQNANYLWNNGLDSSELLIQNSGLYSVIVSIENCSTRDSINIVFITPTTLELGENTILCNDEIIELNAFDTNAISYLWQDNSTLPTLEVTTAGSYFVNVIYNNDCQISDTITFIPEGEIAPTLPNDTIICKNTSVTLNAYQPNAISYEWETQQAYFEQHNLQDSVIIATLSGEYKVTISNECRAFTQTIMLEEEDCGCYPYIPNAFSPNNDGINDFFEVYANCLLQDFNLKIFDRWGGILFESADINSGWDGMNVNENINNGVYVWVLSYKSPNEKGEMTTFTQSGSLTLMR